MTTMHHADEGMQEREFPEQKTFQKEPPRKVHFKETAFVVNIPHISEFSRDEIKSTWYNTNDLDVRKREIADSIHFLKSSSRDILRQHDQCSYGLLTPSQKKHQKHVIYAAIDAVLAEQDLQEEENVHEPEILADIYFLFTERSQWEALDRARRHAERVKHLLLEGEEELMSLPL